MDRETATSLLINWADRLKHDKIPYSVQARRIGMSISTYTAIRIGSTNVMLNTLTTALEGLAREFPELHEDARKAGIKVEEREYTRDELVRLLRDKIRRLQEENEELMDQLTRKKKE